MDTDIQEKDHHIQSCLACEKAIKFVIDQLVKENKENVERVASDVFLRLTNAPALYEGIDITDDYDIRIITKGGLVRAVSDQAPSAGQSQIISMSFISALNRHTAREAPVIVDTPIGRLDPIHKAKLVNFFAKIGSQVIILYQPSELNYGDIQLIHQNVSSEWIMKRASSDPDTTILLEKE